jgi:hypothetical protein
VVGVPLQRACGRHLHLGVTAGGGLDVHDPAGPVPHRVGESARRGVVPEVADDLVGGARGALEPAADEVPPGAGSWHGDGEVIHGPDQAVAGHGERVGRQEAGVPEGGDGRAAVPGQREQPAPADIRQPAVLVVGDDRTVPAPRQVAAAHAAAGPAEIAAEVEQRQVVSRHRGSLGERGQLGPFLAVPFLGGPADGGQVVASGRSRDVLAQPGQHRPSLVRGGQLGPDVLAERAERLALGSGQYDPAQAAEPVLLQRDAHALRQ